MISPDCSSPTVLIVEDEALIRMFASDITAEAGFRVVEVSNADEAMAAIEADPSIGIVFTDIHMAGSMDGLAMSHVVRGRWPPMKFLIVSGHRKVEQGQLPAESKFFSKPYDEAEIVSALHSLAADWSAGPVVH